jgi:hypothetical protein
VLVQTCGNCSHDPIPPEQWCGPSTLGKTQLQKPLMGQTVVLEPQTAAQLPLLRQAWPPGQEQATGCPQVLMVVTDPQRPAQVTAAGSGVQQVPLRQICPAPQLPQEPPQPSSPHCLRRQRGVQVAAGGDGGFAVSCLCFFLCLCLASAASGDRRVLKPRPPMASPRRMSRREGKTTSERARRSKRLASIEQLRCDEAVRMLSIGPCLPSLHTIPLRRRRVIPRRRGG